MPSMEKSQAWSKVQEEKVTSGWRQCRGQPRCSHTCTVALARRGHECSHNADVLTVIGVWKKEMLRTRGTPEAVAGGVIGVGMDTDMIAVTGGEVTAGQRRRRGQPRCSYSGTWRGHKGSHERTQT